MVMRAADTPDTNEVSTVTYNPTNMTNFQKPAPAELKKKLTPEQYDRYDQYLRVVELLARERRLKRLAYVARPRS